MEERDSLAKELNELKARVQAPPANKNRSETPQVAPQGKKAKSRQCSIQ
jgi:hypothetical protein